ncbi:MAG: hypothetical protein K8S99_03130 [Planctomycetes bacterium]|nr:hypothetical protein [Planctomycetota bacterium]
MAKRTTKKTVAAVFPVMAWNWPPVETRPLRRMKENGLTIAGFVAPKDLDAVHRAGLKAIVSDPRAGGYDWRNVDPAVAKRNVASLVREVNRHPAVFGYYVKDEPSAEEFAGLAVVANEFRRLAPGKWPYINLFPDYATPAQLGAPTYDEHLERFIQACRPSILSYDNYSLMENEDVRPAYWTNIESMRAASVRHRIPFWNIVLTVAHFQYREPTAADARFQAYTTMAYGGRGLSYFTYFSPPIGNYRAAAVDQFGNETPTWQYLQHVNLQIANLAPHLLALRSDDAYHLNQVPPTSHGPSAASLVASVGGNNVLVGEFTHRDRSRWVMVVNKSFRDSMWCNPTWRRTPTRVQMVSPYSGRLIPYDGEQRTLAPGQGVLLKIEA